MCDINGSFNRLGDRKQKYLLKKGEAIESDVLGCWQKAELKFFMQFE